MLDRNKILQYNSFYLAISCYILCGAESLRPRNCKIIRNYIIAPRSSR